jgi:hypothetical protein
VPSRETPEPGELNHAPVTATVPRTRWVPSRFSREAREPTAARACGQTHRPPRD